MVAVCMHWSAMNASGPEVLQLSCSWRSTQQNKIYNLATNIAMKCWVLETQSKWYQTIASSAFIYFHIYTSYGKLWVLLFLAPKKILRKKVFFVFFLSSAEFQRFSIRRRKEPDIELNTKHLTLHFVSFSWYSNERF